MKKLLSLLIVPLLFLGTVNSALAATNGVPSTANSIAYHYDPVNKDLIILLADFPVYFLANLNGSDCPDFIVSQGLDVSLLGMNGPRITRVDTNQVCEPVNPVVQIQGDFRQVESVDHQNQILRTLDESGNIHEIHFGPGCEKISTDVKKGLYLGTGWQENQIFLSNNEGKCEILSSQKV